MLHSIRQYIYVLLNYKYAYCIYDARARGSCCGRGKSRFLAKRLGTHQNAKSAKTPNQQMVPMPTPHTPGVSDERDTKNVTASVCIDDDESFPDFPGISVFYILVLSLQVTRLSK